MTDLSIAAVYALNLLVEGQPMPADGALRSGDRFSVTLTLSEPRYVYVAQMGTDGLKTVLSAPAAEEARCTPGKSVRIPLDGGFLAVPALAKKDQICVVVSKNALALATAGARTVLASKDPPPANTNTTRPDDFPEIIPLPTQSDS